jgi:5-methylcytosine-specific restriction endonuclease McrBC regulatory subunit McrC
VAPEPRIVDIRERDKRIFDREDLFDLRGRSLVLPETRELSAVELKDVQDGVQLRALGYIGYLPLTADIVLNLRPKFPVANLWRMLSLADETYDTVLPVLRSYERTTAAGSPPRQLLVRGFCHYLRQIMDLGVAKGYYREPYTGFFRPKVDFGRTISRQLGRGDYLNVSGHLFAFSANLPVNAVLKSACLAFLHVVPRSLGWDADRRLLLEALNALDRVPRGAMRFGDENLADTVPQWTREHYRGALSVYSVLLGYTNVGFAYDAQGNEMPSFLFCLDDIFESFVRNVIRAGYREKKISVTDGNLNRNQRPLFRDNSIYPIKPDAIIRKKKQVLAIAEVKYKPDIEEKDRYQVISHAVALGAPIAFWISPALSVAEAGLKYVGSISTGTKFYHYRLNLDGDLEKAVERMMVKISETIGE